MRFQSISLPFHCGWKRQWGLFLGSTDARNLSSFHASLSPFPHMCFLLFFCSNSRHSHHGAGVTQHRLGQSLLLSKASPKCTGGTVLLERWDMKAGRCIPHPKHFPASSPPPSTSFTSFASPLPFQLCSPLLLSFSCYFFFFSLPSLSPHSHDSTEQQQPFPWLGGSWSPLATSAKIHLPCSLLAFSLLINGNSVHQKGHMFTIPQLVGTCVPGACAKVI